MDIYVSTDWKSWKNYWKLKYEIEIILYVKRVQNIFDCYRVAHVNRILPKHIIPYIINIIDEPKI